jgi:CheY-like chemotaxis protein
MTIFLPEVEAPHSALQAVAPPSERQSATEVILLVEDEPSVRQLTQHILRTHGYEVHEAEGGAQALELIRQQAVHIDLVVTDLVMPGMNGRDLVVRLRDDYGPLKVLYMSGYSDSMPVTGQDSNEQAAFLAKPFAPEDLIKKIQDILHPSLPV